MEFGKHSGARFREISLRRGDRTVHTWDDWCIDGGMTAIRSHCQVNQSYVSGKAWVSFESWVL